MPRRVRYAQAREDFRKRYHVDPTTKCWIWDNDAFRFKVGALLLNPRRFAVYAAGQMIPVARQVTYGCGNPYCINPEHTVMKHNGAKIPNYTPFLIEIGDLHLGSKFLQPRYQRPIDEMREARDETLRMIVRIRHMKGSVHEVAQELDISPSFVQAARKLTPEEFNALKTDPYDLGEEETDTEEVDIPDDAFLFTTDGIGER